MAIKNCKSGCDLKGSRSHAKGGIKGVVEGSQKQIEVESNEVIVRASVLNDPKKYIYTGTHKQIVEQINGGFNAVVNDKDDCILVESGQVVINKKTLDDDKIRTYTGTNKEVLNKINKHLNSGVSIYKNGGIIPVGNNKIKTIFFKKDKFTKPQAVAWAKNHGFDYAQSYDENKSNYIFRCIDKNAFKKHTYRTIELKESGIKIIIGVEKMEQGGSIQNIYELDFYTTSQEAERWGDILYQGIDENEAEKEYGFANEKDEETSVFLYKRTNKYEFVYELDTENEETIEDYPIEYHYEDSDYYKLIEEGEDEIIKSKTLERIKSGMELTEEEFEQLNSDFTESFESQYKNKIHLQEYAGFMRGSKYYYLLLDKNNSLIDFDKENPLLILEKKDSVIDGRISRNFKNVNTENAIICVRISDHEKVYRTYGDACLSIVFDRKSDRVEMQKTDRDNENIVELIYGIEKYFNNYTIAELFDVEHSVDSVIDDFNYNSLIENREEFEMDEYEQGGTITQNTILEKRKQFMSDFMDWYKKDVHEKMNIYITINSEMVTIDLFEKIDQEIDAKPYLKYICDLADKYNIDLFLEPVPRYKFFLKNTEKRKKISKEYLIEYYKKFGFKEIEEGMIRESKMSNFVRTFYSDIQSKYTIEIDKTHDKFEMLGVKGHFEFLIPSDKTEGEILMYFEVQQYRAMADFLNTKGDVIVTPIIKCYIDKDYNITFDYTELDKYLIQNDIEKFDKGGEIVNDKYYILSFGNYIQVKFIEKINIQGIDLFLYNDDGYFGVADEKTGIRIGGSAKEKDRAIDNANDFIEHHGEEKVIEHLKNAQLSPRYSKETKTFEESQFEKIKELYESKNFEKLYEIISNNANTTSRKALSRILERSIVNYNNSQILDLFLEFGYDVRKINLENERLKKQKEAELKQAEIDKQNEYKKTEYPYLDLSNMSAKQFGVLDKAMQKKYRYPDGVKTVSEHIKSLKDEIVETKEFIDEFTKSGDRRSEPLHEYYVKLQSGSLWSIPKLAYDNWVGFKKDTEILQGGVSDNKTILDIANKHDVSLDFANEQLEKGIAVELEHTDSRDIASEIALDHLWESIFYYEELEKMEDKLKENEISLDDMQDNKEKENQNEINFDDVLSEKRDKKISILEKQVGSETRKVINRGADIKISDKIIDEIETNGVTIETLDSLNANVYRYQQQVTIHADFSGINEYRIMGYKSLILNKNKTLGVRYNAIDTAKKKTIQSVLRYFREEKTWFCRVDSSGFSLEFTEICSNKEQFKIKMEEQETRYNSIPDIFIGAKNIFAVNMFGRVYIVVSIILNAIYEENLWKLISFITNGKINNSIEFDSFKIEYDKKRQHENQIEENDSEAENVVYSKIAKIKKDYFLKNFAKKLTKESLFDVNNQKSYLYLKERFGGEIEIVFIKIFKEKGRIKFLQKIFALEKLPSELNDSIFDDKWRIERGLVTDRIENRLKSLSKDRELYVFNSDGKVDLDFQNIPELKYLESIKNKIKSSLNYNNEKLLDICKEADQNNETLVFYVSDEDVEFYKSLGFVVKE